MPNKPDTRALAIALNAGKMQAPQDNVSPFVVRQNELLQREKAQEEQLVQQRMQQEEQQRAMMQHQIGASPVGAPTGPAPGQSASSFLRTMSMGSPRGQAQWQKKEMDDMALAMEIQRLKETPMPAEFGSPGLKGKAFEAFQYMIGRPRGL